MRVEVTEDRLSDSFVDEGGDTRHFLHHKGDIITVPDALGHRWLGHGWAKDVDGVHAAGERKPGAAALEVQSGKFGGKVTNG